MKKFTPLLSLLFFLSCVNKNDGIKSNQTVTAYVPVYMLPKDVNNVSVDAAKATANAGKIYAWANYIFQVEQYEGIHIIDNSVPANAKKIAFLKVPLCTEIAVKGKYLYANNYKDLLVFDVSNISKPQLVKRMAAVFPFPTNQNYPPDGALGYFQCPDSTKGIVVRWEQKLIAQPNCYR